MNDECFICGYVSAEGLEVVEGGLKLCQECKDYLNNFYLMKCFECSKYNFIEKSSAMKWLLSILVQSYPENFRFIGNIICVDFCFECGDLELIFESIEANISTNH